MVYNGITAQDFRQHYEGGWGLASIKKGEEATSVIYIGGIAEGSSTALSYNISVSNGEKNLIVSPTEVSLKFPQPKTGLYNLKDGGTDVVLVRKSADKQFRKAFGVGHYQMVYPLNYALRQWSSGCQHLLLEVHAINKAGNIRMWTRDIVSSVFFPVYPSWDSVVNSILGGEKPKVMCALSTEWMLVQSRVSKYQYELYHGAFPVGYVLPNNKNKVYIQRLYKQEFVDFITRNKFNVEVSETQ